MWILCLYICQHFFQIILFISYLTVFLWRRNVRNQGKEEFSELLHLLSITQRAQDSDFDNSRVNIFFKFSYFSFPFFSSIRKWGTQYCMNVSTVQKSLPTSRPFWYNLLIETFNNNYIFCFSGPCAAVYWPTSLGLWMYSLLNGVPVTECPECPFQALQRQMSSDYLTFCNFV